MHLLGTAVEQDASLLTPYCPTTYCLTTHYGPPWCRRRARCRPRCTCRSRQSPRAPVAISPCRWPHPCAQGPLSRGRGWRARGRSCRPSQSPPCYPPRLVRGRLRVRVRVRVRVRLRLRVRVRLRLGVRVESCPPHRTGTPRGRATRRPGRRARARWSTSQRGSSRPPRAPGEG
eukprot:scaffold19337_cov51-Phaeocystis_antarctica.AAC.2